MWWSETCLFVAVLFGVVQDLQQVAAYAFVGDVLHIGGLHLWF
jgi:hypothetical protein